MTSGSFRKQRALPSMRALGADINKGSGVKTCSSEHACGPPLFSSTKAPVSHQLHSGRMISTTSLFSALSSSIRNLIPRIPVFFSRSLHISPELCWDREHCVRFSNSRLEHNRCRGFLIFEGVVHTLLDSPVSIPEHLDLHAFIQFRRSWAYPSSYQNSMKPSPYAHP